MQQSLNKLKSKKNPQKYQNEQTNKQTKQKTKITITIIDIQFKKIILKKTRI